MTRELVLRERQIPPASNQQAEGGTPYISLQGMLRRGALVSFVLKLCHEIKRNESHETTRKVDRSKGKGF